MDGVGKFSKGTTPVQLRSIMEEALRIGGRVSGQDGRYYVQARFDYQVGWDSTGLAATRVQLLFSPEGDLVDAYPY